MRKWISGAALRWLAPPLVVGLAGDEVSLACAAPGRGDEYDVMATATVERARSEERPQRLRAALSELLADPKFKGRTLRVVLSDQWARYWMVMPPGNAASLADCEVAAAARFATLFGEPMARWAMRADVDIEHPFPACAVPQWLIGAVREASDERGLHLLEIAPQMVVAGNRWGARIDAGDWLGIVLAERLSYAVAGARSWQATGMVGLSEAVLRDQAGLRDVLTREALRLNVPLPETIRLGGNVPASWRMQSVGGLRFHRLDGGPRIATTSPSQWLALLGDA